MTDKVDIEFLEFPELAHQEPVQILKEPSIRGARFFFSRIPPVARYLIFHKGISN